jgi:hypothetical protein
VSFQLANTPGATKMADHPQFPILALSIMASNTLESLCFIPATFLFLYHIIKKLDMNGWKLLTSMFMEHKGFDYILLILTKMYILVGGIVVLLRGGQDNTTNPINYIIPWSHTLAVFIFVCSSFETTQAILNSSGKASKQGSESQPGATNQSRSQRKSFAE